ncbi:UDP-N-acetylmuramoyl-L-alanyl-D-glutamate--2,6-diaminopimelate ligase [Thiohalomonas denitrificans]|uniref:UDP-N-acetylmuramoyl-L-alanyl-D-glutamate--2, 6-diaminopimelate ligase n=1 Tax=Thiohalomonas denitrificans TaxID=415747 RepID=UPI0026F32731|nr:UDP-N-acetylmuramoyl-L-alanyl-D-glutamate--2,6-diaminopimelate ligase [Thiohalomonas denitrificans]
MMAASIQTPGIRLGELLTELADPGRFASVMVSGIALDSRRVVEGGLFLALSGHSRHGLEYVESAVARGAAAILTESADDEPASLYQGVPLIKVRQLTSRAGRIAGRFYGEPSRQMHVIGVTGTNGKTSVSHFIASSLQDSAPCGVMGTLGAGVFGALHSTGHTTPDPVTLQALLNSVYSAGVNRLVMEVSSHALVQERVAGVAFDTAVFTNLTHEHLDYHGNMEAYAAAKRQLFEQPGLKTAVINADDPVGSDWLARLDVDLNVIDYGLAERHGRSPRLLGTDVRLGPRGLSLVIRSPWGSGTLATGLLGRFNAHNLLAALGALLAAGLEFDDALERLSRVQTVPGRMESFGGGGHRPLVVVDYAHTPDALEHVLRAAGEHCRGNLWCVFGCGGDRDRDKRPLMGRIAERYADFVVMTDDNPRNEDPYLIIEQIRQGMADPDAVQVIRDRGEAMACALQAAVPGDVVVIAGKGHESEQVMGGRSLPFSDRETAARLLGEEVPSD